MNLKFKINVKQKIIFSVLIIGLMSEVVGLSIIFFIGKSSLKTSIGETFKELARLTSDRLELLIEHHVEEGFSLATADSVHNILEEPNQMYNTHRENDVMRNIAKINKEWKNISKNNSILQNIINNQASDFMKNYGKRYKNRLNKGIHYNLMATDSKGVVRAALNKPEHYYYGDTSWWLRAYKGGEGGVYLSDIGFDKDINKYIFIIAVPIMKNKKAVGVFAMIHDVDQFFGWVTSVKVGNTDHTMLVSYDGTILFCPIFPTGTHRISDDLKSEIFKDQPGWGVTEYDVHYDEETINGYAPVSITASVGSVDFGGKKWYIFTSQDPNETYASVYKLLRWIEITGIAGIGAWLLLGWILANNIVNPIRELKKGAKVIGDGNLDYNIIVKSEDEIGDLADEFNKMARKLKTYYTELEHLSKLKSEFVSKVSHELRTPLTSIKAFVEILLTYKDIDQKTIMEFLNIVNEESGRLGRLINDLLDLSKIESGKKDWIFEPVNISEVVNFSIKSMRVMANGKKLSLTAVGTENLPMVTGDRDLFIQVLDNLINNAIKFTDNGAIVVRGYKDENMVTLMVKDTGIGIPEDKIDMIFEKFHQIGNVETEKPGGTGLGLAISKEIVTHLGGNIWCESEQGKGSVFYFTIPIAR